MVMATETRPWTRHDLARLPNDGNRYEVLDGQLLVSPQTSMPHQLIAFEIANRVRTYCDAHDLGFLVTTPCAVPEGSDELQPDIGVYPAIPLPIPEKWEDGPRPLLVIEVLSRSTGHRDRGVKRTAYTRWHIPEYWIVDRFRRDATIVVPGRADAVITDVVRWAPVATIRPFEMGLTEIFGRVE